MQDHSSNWLHYLAQPVLDVAVLLVAVLSPCCSAPAAGSDQLCEHTAGFEYRKQPTHAALSSLALLLLLQQTANATHKTTGCTTNTRMMFSAASLAASLSVAHTSSSLPKMDLARASLSITWLVGRSTAGGTMPTAAVVAAAACCCCCCVWPAELSLTQSAAGTSAPACLLASAAGTRVWREARGAQCAEASHSLHRKASSLRQ